MAREKDSIPTGRIRRTAKVAGLAGGQTARNYATRAANLTRDKDGRREAAAKRQAEAAEQILEVLGNMKGAAMKVGQVASFIDTGAFPEEFQERIQTKLAELRDSAPQVSFKDMRKVIEAELGEKLKDEFADFDEHAVAAASIGQVYRATLHDGRDVAVKVQYPGVAQAVRSDLQNLGMIMRVAKRIAPGMDAKAMTAEIRERLEDELDYEQEAQAQRAFARAYRDHPFVVIPEVVSDLCRERVLVTEWVEGEGFEDIRSRPDADRDRYGEMIFRFFFGSMHRNRHFSGDPHPGNFRFMADGRIAFLDFGLTKTISADYIVQEAEVFELGMAGDAQALFDKLAGMGFFDVSAKAVTPDAVLAHFRAITQWYIDDRPVTIDKEMVARVLIEFGDPRSEHFRLMRHETLPPDALLGRRTEGLTVGVLGQLVCTANWNQIYRELAMGAPTQSALGEEEAAYYAAA